MDWDREKSANCFEKDVREEYLNYALENCDVENCDLKKKCDIEKASFEPQRQSFELSNDFEPLCECFELYPDELEKKPDLD